MFKSIKINPVIDEIKRVRGKKMTLLVNKDGKVIVRAPHILPIKEINTFVESKLDWIQKSKHKAISNSLLPKNFENGEKFLYLGIERELVVIDNPRYTLSYSDDKFYLDSRFINNAKELFESLYKNLAWNFIGKRTYELAKQYNFKFTNVKINSAKTKWGSCSSKKSLNFSWHLALAPVDVIEYVIIHELAHTIEMNHSDKFWKIVEKIIPDYKSKIQWLKENGHKLNI